MLANLNNVCEPQTRSLGNALLMPVTISKRLAHTVISADGPTVCFDGDTDRSYCFEHVDSLMLGSIHDDPTVMADIPATGCNIPEKVSSPDFRFHAGPFAAAPLYCFSDTLAVPVVVAW